MVSYPPAWACQQVNNIQHPPLVFHQMDYGHAMSSYATSLYSVVTYKTPCLHCIVLRCHVDSAVILDISQVLGGLSPDKATPIFEMLVAAFPMLSSATFGDYALSMPVFTVHCS